MSEVSSKRIQLKKEEDFSPYKGEYYPKEGIIKVSSPTEFDEEDTGFTLAHELGHAIMEHSFSTDEASNLLSKEFEATLWALSRRGRLDDSFMDEIDGILSSYRLESSNVLDEFTKAIDNVNSKRLATSYKLPKKELVKWFKLFYTDYYGY